MSFRNSYGWLDRCLHRMAFATPSAQLGVADLELRMFRRELEGVRAARPLFVTGLPRSGTTILLELLSRAPSVATHTYRDMPFVLTPMTWGGFARRFRRSDAPRERAHGDGIQISMDSPEAFEEVAWMAFHADRYRGASIAPWAGELLPEFASFFAEHMRKVIALRRRDKPTAARYASKNNLNIARLPALLARFDDAVALVPFRDPLQHGASLLRQHRRFSEMHARDGFTRRYMAGIGHFDFGENLKPVDFDGWLAGRDASAADSLSFWVEYWCAAYGALLRAADHGRVHLLSFERLGAAEGLAALATAAALDPDELTAHASLLSPAADRDVDDADVPAALRAQADALYAQLRARCLLGAGPGGLSAGSAGTRPSRPG